MNEESKYAINMNTNRLLLKSTAKYKKLKKLGQVKEISTLDEAPQTEPTETEPIKEPEFNEKDLQHKMAELTTDMVANNMKQIVKSQRLSDKDMDILLKKMLYQKLCSEKPKKKPMKKKSKKSKFKLVEPSSDSDSDSESD
jgi:hypothetical protein